MDWLEEAKIPVYKKLIGQGREKLAQMYRQCFRSTWDTTLQRSDGTVFLITGDIPAMWLRDSSAQVYHYLPYAKGYPEVMEAIQGLLKRQFQYIALDPYANAFNREASGKHGFSDHTNWSKDQEPWIWEHKYEVDSLCYPIRLAYGFWKETGDASWCDGAFRKAAETILKVWTMEQHHMEQSPNYFERSDCPPSDTLPNAGKGTPVTYTGMTWSGFRPSDDACRYGYLIPSNFFAAETLRQMSEMAVEIIHDDALSAQTEALREQIQAGIRQYAVVRHPRFGDVYAYETDGLGHYLLMDDANVPSLLSLPYLGCVDAERSRLSKHPTHDTEPRKSLLLSGQMPHGHRQSAYAQGLYLAHLPVRAGADGQRSGRKYWRLLICWKTWTPERASCTKESARTIPPNLPDPGLPGPIPSSANLWKKRCDTCNTILKLILSI